MTRDAEHTPNGYEDAASVVVNQAPAPSSLAGGEVNRAARSLLDACIADFGDPTDYPDDDGWVASGDSGDSAVTFKHMRDLQAALSPEAPALDTGEWFGVTGAADETEALAVALFDARCPGIRMTDEDLHYYRAAAQRAMKAVADELDTPALTPRHEDPAEGAGSFAGSLAVALEDLSNAAEVVRRMLHNSKDHQSRAFNEAGVPFVSAINRAKLVLKDYDRARSSAPEAREHPCYGEHQPGCDCIIPAQTEREVPPFLKRMTEAREGEVVAWGARTIETRAIYPSIRATKRGAERMIAGIDAKHEHRLSREPIALYTHPAALTPRHEAPAEGAGERDRLREIDTLTRQVTPDLATAMYLLASIQEITEALLRAQPQAREEAKPGQARVPCMASMDTKGDCSTLGGCDCPAAPRADRLREVVDGIDSDYMTSETHHPGYVLIPTAKFDAIVAVLQEAVRA